MLFPLSLIYSFVKFINEWKKTPKKTKGLVFCVGNVVVGGAGKTPFSLFLVESLKKLSQKPHVLSRGYGKKSLHQNGLVLNQSPQEVGEEPLILSRFCPTWVGKNRYESSFKAFESGASCVVLDDGMQHNALKKDVTFLIVDAKQQFGNEFLLPAGPLRESLKECAKKTTAVCVLADHVDDVPPVHETLAHLPHFVFYKNYHTSLSPQKVMAFCALGYPWKFFDSLKSLAFECIETSIFPDHHFYTDQECEALMMKSKELGVPLITTEKDFVKLPPSFQSHVFVLSLSLEAKNPTLWNEFLSTTLESYSTSHENS